MNKQEKKELRQSILVIITLIVAFLLLAHYSYRGQRPEVDKEFGEMLEKQYLLDESKL